MIRSFVVLVFGFVCCCVAPPQTASSRLRLVSYNIRHGRGMDDAIDLDRIAEVIRAAAPDVVTLQEVDQGCRRSGGVDQASVLGELLGMQHVFGEFMAYDGGRYGMAVLSRHPMVATTNVVLPPGSEPRSALEARIRLPGGAEVIVAGIHLYETETERLDQARVLVDRYAGSALPVILAGDVNSEPGSGVMELLEETWVNAAKQGPADTYPADEPRKEIDFVLVPGDDRCVVRRLVVLDERVASDHRPLMGELELAGPRVAAAAATAATSAGGARPNIVYVLADDMGCGDVSCLNPDAAWTTPNIDRLAGEGMSFTDAHSGSAVCTPTRYGILTGRYAWRSRLAKGVLGGDSAHLIDPDRMTVASLLHGHGYHCACFGKWHLGWDFARRADDPKAIDYAAPVTHGPLANGFDHYYCHCGSLDMAPYVYVEDDRITAAPDRTTKNDDFQGFWREGATGADFEHGAVLQNFAGRAVDYVRERARTGQPFFLYLALPAPHTPILPSAGFRGLSKTNPYGDYVLEVDAVVGALMAAVETAGIGEQTLFVVTADNGCSPRAKFDELATFGHHPSGPFRGHKADIFEGGHRVPFVVRWPGHVGAGQRSDQTICLTDLMATCAEVIGVPLPAGAGEDSISLMPALCGTASAPLREATVHHSINGSFAIRQGRWKLAFCPGSGGWSEPVPAAARRQRLPLLQLFDLEADPAERDNRAAEQPEVVSRLTALLERYVVDGRSTPGPARKNDRGVWFLPEPYAKP
ncbi:MAG: sulfatase-like hydrolase/transferase [Planctomycetes bacterium]|nr:sulfatase-like hydrolase/transferase [Planctomycetota bacterium]